MKKRTPEDLALLIAPRAVSPDTGCVVLMVGTALLLASFAFWFFFYLRNAQEFQGQGTPQGPPPSQIKQERDAAREGRLNR